MSGPSGACLEPDRVPDRRPSADPSRLERLEKAMEREPRYSDKEHREVEHIIESEGERGHSPEEAERIGYATVNKHRNEQVDRSN